jgi:hypothetical protein
VYSSSSCCSFLSWVRLGDIGGAIDVLALLASCRGAGSGFRLGLANGAGDSLAELLSLSLLLVVRERTCSLKLDCGSSCVFDSLRSKECWA